MKNLSAFFILILFSLFSFSSLVLAQVTGDYRTTASGNWDALATWQMFNGTTWVAATVKPGTANNVLVGNGFNVIANTNEACKDLIVQDGSTLTLSHNIVNSGNVSVGGIIDFGISTLQNKGGGGSNENFTVGGSPVSLTGNITNGSNTIVIAGAFSGVIPGMTITGTGIPINTCALSVSGFNIIMSQPATATAAGVSLSINGACRILIANPLGLDGSIIQISRNFTNGASYVFNGATTTPFPASTPVIAKDLTVNSSITLNDPVTVNGTMTLNTGIILTTSGPDLLTLGPSASFIGGNAGSFINGPLQLTNTSTSPTSLFFPIGKDNSYRPVSLNLTQTTAAATTYKAEVFNVPPVSRALPSTLDRVSFNRYYNIIKGTGSNVTSAHITLNYDVSGIDDGVTDASNLRVAKDNGLGGWVDLGGDASSINFTGNITPANSFTTFGDFVLANNKGGSNLLGGQLPSPPVLVSPSNLAVNVAVNTSLVWSASPGAATYRLVLAADQNFTNIILNDSTLIDTIRLVGPLQNNTNYFWKISGKNFLGTGTFSSTFKFTTIVAAPGIPTLVSPANNSANQPVNLSLNWNSVPFAAKYGVQVATDSSFNTLLINDTTVITTGRAVSGLLNSTKYFWRVNANNVGGTSSFSSTFNFTTILGTPQLLSPVNGETQGSTAQQFIWSSVNGAQTYHFQLAKDSLFALMVHDDSLLTSSTTLVQSLTLNTKYFWRVLAKNQFSISAYSTIFNFIAAVTGINDKSGTLPTVYNLYQNYPNPFNPSTTISYSLPQASDMRLVLYNSLGQSVRVIEDGFKNAGNYHITLNAVNLPSGVYFYKLDAKQFSQVRKMVLTK